MDSVDKPEVTFTPSHKGHLFCYTEEGEQSYRADIGINGDIVVSYNETIDSDVTDTYLFCLDCNVRVSGAEIGANDDWEVVDA